MIIFHFFEILAHCAAIVGIGIGAYQLWQTRKQAQTTFEDSMAKEYRELASRFPTKVFYDIPFSEELTPREKARAQDEFYRYFDLTNGQIFLREAGRISDQTWAFWCDGIKTNMQRAAFKAAWNDIGGKAQLDFAELRLLIEVDYELDPISPNWMHRICLKRQEVAAKGRKLKAEESDTKEAVASKLPATVTGKPVID